MCILYFQCFCLTIFTTGCSLADLTPADAVGLCAERGFANTLPIPSGVVCYNRTTARAEAVYCCDDGFQQNGAQARVCQNDGTWNGSTPQSFPDPEQDGMMIMSVSIC